MISDTADRSCRICTTLVPVLSYPRNTPSNKHLDTAVGRSRDESHLCRITAPRHTSLAYMACNGAIARSMHKVEWRRQWAVLLHCYLFSGYLLLRISDPQNTIEPSTNQCVHGFGVSLHRHNRGAVLQDNTIAQHSCDCLVHLCK